MRVGAFLCVVLWAWTANVSAQTTQAFNSQRFRPAITPRDGLALVLPTALGKRAWSAQATLGFEKEPLVSGAPNGEVAIIDQRLSVTLDVAVALMSRLDLFVSLPFTAYQRGDDLGAAGLAEPDSAGLEDPRVGLRVQLLDGKVFDLGLLAGLGIPIGAEEAFVGDDGINAEGRLLASVDLDVIILALDVGARYRPIAHFRDLDIGSEASLRAGIHVPLIDRKLRLFAELDGATRVTDGAFSSLGSPVEALFGGRYAFESGMTAGLGGGVAINGAAGTPAGRVFLHVGYVGTPRDKQSDDEDGDRVLAANDQCPAEPEDRDGVDDADGCPDVDDSDGDGIADASDHCHDAPEDGYGEQPGDGCPTVQAPAPLDQDSDKVADASDRCPSEAEDADGFADDDGCPDLDNDADGVADASDSCPREIGPAPNGCPAPATEVQVAAARPDKETPVEFERNSSSIPASSNAALLGMRDRLRAHPEERLHIVGYASEGGSEDHNAKLSARRAEVVRAALIAKGVPAARIRIEGRGTREPRADNSTDSGRRQNQRVEFNWEK